MSVEIDSRRNLRSPSRGQTLTAQLAGVRYLPMNSQMRIIATTGTSHSKRKAVTKAANPERKS